MRDFSVVDFIFSNRGILQIFTNRPSIQMIKTPCPAGQGVNVSVQSKGQFLMQRTLTPSDLTLKLGPTVVEVKYSAQELVNAAKLLDQ